MRSFRSSGLIVLGLAILSTAVPAADAVAVDDATVDAILGALEDERRSEALYLEIIDELGKVRPFSNIVRAEQRHAEHLENLMDTLGIDVPPNDRSNDRFGAIPATRQEACRQAMVAEQNNVALYDEYLEFVTDPATVELFEILRAASLERHLPAFERCSGSAAAGAGPGGCCGGCARGNGKGRPSDLD